MVVEVAGAVVEVDESPGAEVEDVSPGAVEDVSPGAVLLGASMF